jgi:predicted dehydrogenase
LIGNAGAIRAEDALNVEHPIEIQLQRDGKVVETSTVSNLSVYALQVDAFADAIEGKSQFPIPGEEGWQNQEVLDAALRSLKRGSTEDVSRVSL